MKKLRNWIIRKLGGVPSPAVPMSSIPLSIQMDLMQYWTNKTIDKQAEELFGKSFMSE